MSLRIPENTFPSVNFGARKKATPYYPAAIPSVDSGEATKIKQATLSPEEVAAQIAKYNKEMISFQARPIEGVRPVSGQTYQQPPQGENITLPKVTSNTLGLANERNFGPIYGNNINGKENILGENLFKYA